MQRLRDLCEKVLSNTKTLLQNPKAREESHIFSGTQTAEQKEPSETKEDITEAKEGTSEAKQDPSESEQKADSGEKQAVDAETKLHEEPDQLSEEEKEDTGFKKLRRKRRRLRARAVISLGNITEFIMREEYEFHNIKLGTVNEDDEDETEAAETIEKQEAKKKQLKTDTANENTVSHIERDTVRHI